VKVSKGDLTISMYTSTILFFYSFFALMLPLVYLLAYVAGGSNYAVLAFILALILAMIVVLTRRCALVHVDFQKIRATRKTGRILEYVFVVPTLYLFATLLLTSFGLSVLGPFELLPYLIGAFEGFVIGVIFDQYANVFVPDALARLCFRQVKELKYPLQKLGMIRQAFKNLGEVADAFGLEFDTSRVEYLFAFRLFDGANVDKELDRVQSRLSDGASIPAALSELSSGVQDCLTAKKTTRQRWSPIVESTVKILGLILALVPYFLILMEKLWH
jgi:hypothetical protein